MTCHPISIRRTQIPIRRPRVDDAASFITYGTILVHIKAPFMVRRLFYYLVVHG